MNDHWHEKIQRCMTGDATQEEVAALQDALKNDAELRALYLDYLNLDLALETAAMAMGQSMVVFEQRPTAKLSAWARFSLAALPLGAAAAAVAIFLPSQKPMQIEHPSDAEQVAQIIFQKQFPDSH